MNRGLKGDSGGMKKKMVIKPFKSQPKVPDNFEMTSWQLLENAVHAVCTNTSIDTSKEVLYRTVEDLCLHKFYSSIYEKLYEKCKQYIYAKVDSLTEQSMESSRFLEVVDGVWKEHCEHMMTIRNIFLYLDQSYAFPTDGRQTIWDMGVSLFRERLARWTEVEEKIISGLLIGIQAERNGQTADTDTLHRIIRMLIAQDTYKDKFEKPFLQVSRQFFVEEGLQMVMETDVAVFLLHVEMRLEQAVSMATHYLSPETLPRLLRVLEEALLQPHIGTLVSRGAPILLEAERVADLRRLFCMCNRVDSLHLLKDSWVNYLRSTGTSLVNISVGQQDGADKNVVENVIVFQDKTDSILKGSFDNKDEFRVAWRSSFEYFINVNQTRMAELLARHVDRKLRGEKGVSEAEIESALDKVLLLFRHLQGKDLFEAFYKKNLAKRLLLGKSASSDNEKSMIGRMRLECGVDYTAKLEGMFTDMELARSVMGAYRDHCRELVPLQQHGGVDVDIQVLTTGFWPSYPTVDIVLPRELSYHKQRFDTFYSEKYQGRRLAWQYVVDRCVVTARLPKGKKELEVSLLQATVLVCFSSRKELSFTDIREETHIQVDELRRLLQSLACGKIGTRVLVKEPKGREVNDGDVFRVDESFTNKLFRIKINTIQLKETVEEVEKTKEEVFRDRQYEVDAIVVRLMKARRKMTHNQLMSEVFSLLKFSASSADVKKRVESLIERDYLERDEDDNSTYNYLA